MRQREQDGAGEDAPAVAPVLADAGEDEAAEEQLLEHGGGDDGEEGDDRPVGGGGGEPLRQGGYGAVIQRLQQHVVQDTHHDAGAHHAQRHEYPARYVEAAES